MSRAQDSFPLVAVDIGNSRIKLALFDKQPGPGEFPEPKNGSRSCRPDWQDPQLSHWLAAEKSSPTWLIASVQRATSARLITWLQSQSIEHFRLLTAADLPLDVRLEYPERVGIDRLVNAVAVNRLREAKRAAIVIDVGSAITVDAVSAEGAFLGGSIVPGIGMSARALHEFTDLLPLSEMTELAEPPEPLGKSTVSALRSGLFWGAVGAMRELTTRLSADLSRPHVFLTGGAAPSVAEFLVDVANEPARYVPHLTLAGIALSARS
jgi:type III pantothenate kinase